jgi:acyl-ACP thioesterase
MILILVSFIALVYSLTVQSKRAIKKMQTLAYKKTPEYQEFEKQLNDILINHKVNNSQNSFF